MAFNLEEAARLYTRELLARAWAMLGDWHEAEDAVQDAFAAACEKPPKPGGERAWLHRVTYRSRRWATRQAASRRNTTRAAPRP